MTSRVRVQLFGGRRPDTITFDREKGRPVPGSRRPYDPELPVAGMCGRLGGRWAATYTADGRRWLWLAGREMAVTDELRLSHSDGLRHARITVEAPGEHLVYRYRLGWHAALMRVIDPTYDYVDASFDDFGLDLVGAVQRDLGRLHPLQGVQASKISRWR